MCFNHIFIFNGLKFYENETYSLSNLEIYSSNKSLFDYQSTLVLTKLTMYASLEYPQCTMVGIYICCPKSTGKFAFLIIALIIQMPLNFYPNANFYHFQLINAFFSILNYVSLSINGKCLTIFWQNFKIRNILYRHAFSKQQKGKHCTMG